jgi:hypothetical protein
MDTLSAWGMAQASRGQELKVFDWHKAAAIIKEKIEERARMGQTINITAEAGLASDYEWTLGPIYQNGKRTPERGTTYLVSTWAIPMLIIDGDEEQACYKMKSETPGWDAETWWPESAVEILEKEVRK